MPHLPFHAFKHRWNPLSSQHSLVLDPRQSLYEILLDCLDMLFDIRWLSHFRPIHRRASRVNQYRRLTFQPLILQHKRLVKYIQRFQIQIPQVKPCR